MKWTPSPILRDSVFLLSTAAFVMSGVVMEATYSLVDSGTVAPWLPRGMNHWVPEVFVFLFFGMMAARARRPKLMLPASLLLVVADVLGVALLNGGGLYLTTGAEAALIFGAAVVAGQLIGGRV